MAAILPIQGRFDKDIPKCSGNARARSVCWRDAPNRNAVQKDNGFADAEDRRLLLADDNSGLTNGDCTVKITH